MAAEAVGEYHGSLHSELIDLERRRIDREIKEARLSGDRAREGELARAKHALRQELDSVAGEAS